MRRNCATPVARYANSTYLLCARELSTLPSIFRPCTVVRELCSICACYSKTCQWFALLVYHYKIKICVCRKTRYFVRDVELSIGKGRKKSVASIETIGWVRKTARHIYGDPAAECSAIVLVGFSVSLHGTFAIHSQYIRRPVRRE